ncbi:hypothetical protein P8629_01545 [Hydrogenovibrio sp. 3SP14C1]|uniref:hypothetical protein n=1 Tax=Hydrogenovibrio sp. 3SP14C1 TaxID=3038774 RepID=UPI002417A3E6|nr:hypothetical protein [Hydrogenovibrio sp. 3SP14C1]MDG4811680.1 hypothetical protein [Hydrogenovibrio sp. 3SP14C1]
MSSENKENDDQASFANGVFVALQIIREHAYNGDDVALSIAEELIEAIGGIEFLEEHVEDGSEVDQETIEWYQFVFRDE